MFKKRILIAALSLSLLACGVTGTLVAANALEATTSAQVEWEALTIPTHRLNDSFELPSRTVSVGGVTYSTQAKITRPDGTSTSARTVTLNQAGLYTVQHFVVIDGKPYAIDTTFKVNNNAYVFLSDSSKGTYGKGVYSHSPDAEGLYINLAEKDTVELQQIIEIPSSSADISLLQYFIAPNEPGKADFTKITFTFTDVLDPSCSLRIMGQSASPNSADGRGGSYFLAAGSGQILKGWNYNVNRVDVNNNYGTFITTGSFYGEKVTRWASGLGDNGETAPMDDPSTGIVELRFNPATCEVKVNYGSGYRVIADMDSNDYFGGLTDVKWTGFKSGKVRLSVKAEGYTGSVANFVLKSVAGVDLSEEIYRDVTPPEITINTKYEINNMPKARVGANAYYPVPTASAYDLDSGVCDVKVAVYKNYNSSSRSQINIVDGKFKTTTAGDYAILYRAVDAAGNEAREAIFVHAVADNQIESLVISGFEDAVREYEAGAKAVIPIPAVSGGSGDISLSVRAYTDNEEIVIDTSKDEWCFYPENMGTWTVEYTATDYTGYSHSETYIVTVTAATKPTVRDTVVLPEVFIAGFDNLLPALTVYDYSSGELVKTPAKVKVEDANGTKIYNAGTSFVPKVNKNGDKIKITYQFASGENVQDTVDIPVINGYESSILGNRLQIANYFYSEEKAFATQTYSNGLRITANAGDHAWLFANSLISQGFSLQFGMVKDDCAFDKITVTLTDTVNKAQSLEIVFTRAGSGMVQATCGSVSEIIKLVNFNAGGIGEPSVVLENLTVSFQNGRLLLGGTACDPDLNADGTPFTGFSSGKVYLRFKMEGAVANAKYYVSSVNSHSISTLLRDMTSPFISLLGDYGGTYDTGDVYEICAATSADVLAPMVDFRLNVTAPDGSYVTDLDGVLLKDADPTVTHKITLSQYGQYKIVYSASEKGAPSTNAGDKTVLVNVIDNEAPVAQVNAMPTQVKKGGAVSLSSYTVTDNVSPTDKIQVLITVCNPNGRRTLVTGNEFICEIVGAYEFRYTFIDEAGNESVYTFTVNVIE